MTPFHMGLDKRRKLDIIRPMSNQTHTLPNGVIIQSTNIIGTDEIVLSAWKHEPCCDSHENGPSTVQRLNDRWYGRIGTFRVGYSSIKDMPIGEERSEMVRIHYDQQYQEAYDLIMQSPFAKDIKGKGYGRRMGEISYWK